MPTGIWFYIVAHRWPWPPLLPAGAIVSAVLHNVLSGIVKTDEPVFFPDLPSRGCCAGCADLGPGYESGSVVTWRWQEVSTISQVRT